MRHLGASALTLIFVLTAAGCSAQPTHPLPEANDDALLNVLFVGNSLTYTNDLPSMLAALMATAGYDPHIESVAFPNYGLQDHWVTGGARAAIDGGGWDVVVLQQGPSATEGRPSLVEYSEKFDETIRESGARTALYMVWPSSNRMFDFDGVSESYTMAAERVNGLLFPVGDAWQLAWERTPSLELYGGDGFHPSLEGTYLAAMVMYHQLTGASPVGLPGSLQVSSSVELKISDGAAALLQAAAVEANERVVLKR